MSELLDLQLQQGVHELLNSLHKFAATAKFEEYFSLFHPDGQFIGTDDSENWTVPSFKEWARPYFEGVECAWEYIPIPGRRKIVITPTNGAVTSFYAVFDEVLYCSDLKCHTRGSGTVIFEDGHWSIGLYYLSFPIPDQVNNRIMNTIVRGKSKIKNMKVLEEKEKMASAAAEQLLQELALEEIEASSKGSKNTKKKKKK